MINSSNSHLKQSAWLSSISFVSRIFGFLREMIKAYIFGTSALGDAFQIAFVIPNLFRRLTAEGVLLNTFIPHLSQVIKHKGESGGKDFFYSVFWILLIFLIIGSGIFIYYCDFFISNIFASGFSRELQITTVFLTRIMFSYIIFISIAALFQGVLNYHRHFIISALTPIFLNISIISGGLIFFKFTDKPVIGLAFGVLFGGLLQALIQLPKLLKLGYKFIGLTYSFRPYLKRMLINTGPGIIGAGIYQIDIVINNVIATHLQAGSVIALNFSNRLLDMALGIFVISQTTVLLPIISKAFSENQIGKITRLLSNSIKLISFILLPLIVGMILTAPAIIEILFGYGKFDQNSIKLTAGILVFHLPGMIAIGWNRTLMTVYHAKKLYKITMIMAFLTMVANVTFALFLSTKFNAAGIALANSISQCILSILLIFFLYSKTSVKLKWKEMFFKNIYKHIVGIIFIFFAVFLVNKLNFSLIWIDFFMKVITGTSTYLLLCWLLKVEELKIILKLFKKN